MGISQQIGASSLSKPGVCTSSTRPATPYEGQMIYETDTDKVLVWNGTAWYANWNTAWGQVGLQTITSIFTTSATHTTFQDTGMTLNVTEVNGRCYKITASSNIYTPGGVQSIEMRLLRNAAALKQNNFPDSVMPFIILFINSGFLIFNALSFSFVYKLMDIFLETTSKKL